MLIAVRNANAMKNSIRIIVTNALRIFLNLISIKEMGQKIPGFLFFGPGRLEHCRGSSLTGSAAEYSRNSLGVTIHNQGQHNCFQEPDGRAECIEIQLKISPENSEQRMLC